MSLKIEGLLFELLGGSLGSCALGDEWLLPGIEISLTAFRRSVSKRGRSRRDPLRPHDKEEVWKALADFGNICHGHPGVIKSWITSDKKEGIGATRHCDFTMMGASADEKIVEWNDGKNIKIEVYQLNKLPGINTMALDLAIRENGAKTILTSTMAYTMKNGFFDVMNNLMMKKMNAKLLDGIMAGHKLYIETGTIVTEKTKLDLNQVKHIN